MKTRFLIPVIAGMLIFSACEKASLDTDLKESGKKSGTVVQNFKAHLSGDEEVPARQTLSTGQAIFQLSKDGLTLYYKLIVANLDSITMSHIHVAPAGRNGQVVAWLFPPAPPATFIPEKFSGILQEGSITASNLVGPLAGHPLSHLIRLIENDSTYVNVHTRTFPGGEIRGQIK